MMPLSTGRFRQLSWGGFKYSGVGREYGRYGIEAFVETRAILES
jgi:aldehyde dehydrogenase (NAD+)